MFERFFIPQFKSGCRLRKLFRFLGTWWVYTGVRGANSNSGWEMQQSVTILSVTDRTVEDMKSYEKRKTAIPP